jgi:hypothetical protein
VNEVVALTPPHHNDDDGGGSTTHHLGLGTVYHIDGITVAVYGVRNHPVGVPSRFVPYTAMAHILPYFTAVNTVRVTTYKT